MGKKSKPKPELIWKALEETKHTCNPIGGEPILNKAGLVSKTEQSSSETIEILDSCDITVSTTDLQAAVSLQSAIAIVVKFFIADSTLAEKVTQGLFERAQIMQTNQQRLVIVNSRSVDVTTVDIGVVISFN